MKKIFVWLIIIFTIFPSFASATSTAELQAQIANLLKQIEQLQNLLVKMQSQQSTKWCHTFNKDFGVGSSGDDVYALSIALLEEGYDLGKFDGYDEIVASTISSFQEKYKSEILIPVGLTHGTGYVGARTRAKLNALYGCSSANPSSTSSAPTIKIISPNGGERYMSEKGAFTARWQSSDNQPVNLYLLDKASPDNIVQQYIGTNITGGQYGVDLSAHLLEKDVNSFRLRACLSKDTSICDNSDSYFSFYSTATY